MLQYFFMFCLYFVAPKILLVKMQPARQEGISLRGECTIYHNGLQINSKKKSKLAVISLDTVSQLLIVVGKGQGQEFKFPIKKLKTIHRKFIDQGKATLQFDQQVEGTIQKGLHAIKDNIQSGGSFQIFIDGASKENLQILIQNLIKFRKGEDNIKSKKEDGVENNRKKRLSRIQEEDDQDPHDRAGKNLSKRDLMKLINNGGIIKVKKDKKEEETKSMKETEHRNVNRVRIDFGDLPHLLLNQIFAFSGFSLTNRLICKKLESFVLKNIFRIRLKDEIDEESFNRLCKWAVNVQCRMKNVKKLDLADRYDYQDLRRNRAKTLNFGNWKEISHKNVQQLKGLRIYCLQIPYLIRFQLSHLFGLRLVELRLKGKQVTIRNAMVKDQNLLYLINNVKQLRVIEVCYASTKLLTGIKEKQKMQEIRIGTLNKVSEEKQQANWGQLNNFSSLKILGIEDSQTLGMRNNHQQLKEDISWPAGLKQLDVGINLSQSARTSIPTDLAALKLMGEHWRNSDILDFFLPSLERLDIAGAPLLTHQCLANMANLSVQTHWNSNRVESARNFYAPYNINITTSRGFTYC